MPPEAETETEADGTPPHRDPEVLSSLYHGEGLTQKEVGERLDIPRWKVSNLMRELDIPRRSSAPEKQPASLVKVHPDPVKGAYLRWDDHAAGESVYVGQLLAISEGADPHDIFNKRVNVRFDNGRRDDLRPENLDIVSMVGHPWQDKERLKEALGEVSRIDELADRWDVNYETIRRHMRKFGLSRHYDSETGWYVEESEPPVESES